MLGVLSKKIKLSVTHLFHLVKAFTQVLVQVRLHPGHNALQFNSLVQQLPVILQKKITCSCVLCYVGKV